MKFEIHIHSTFSDGINTIREIAEEAKRKGLNGISITDHDTMDGIPLARKICKEVGLDFLPGAEITTNIGHVLIYGITKLPKESKLSKFLDAVRKLGGVSVLAHPYYSAFLYDFPEKEKLIKKFDAIEVINGNMTPEQNIFAIKLAKKFDMVGTGGSDAHFRGNIGKIAIDFDGSPVESIKNGNLKLISSDPEIKKLIKLWSE